MHTWLHGTIAVFLKDLRLELRNRYAINMLLLFVLSSLLLVLFSVGQETLSPPLMAALLWIIVLFSTVVGLGRSFISEEEQGTVLLLQLHLLPSSVYAGKLLFNTILTLVVNLVTVLAFLIILGMRVLRADVLLLTLLLGAIGLAGAITLLSAIIARTVNRGPLLPVLAFPLLIPLLLSVISATRKAIIGTRWVGVADDLLTLVGYAGVVITASFLLFDYVWKD